MNSFPQAVNCTCTHKSVVQMVPVDDGPGEDWVFVGFRIALEKLTTFTIICRLFVNDVTSDTVCILFRFNVTFPRIGVI